MHCWQCGRPNDPADEVCGWCGVWLVDLRADRVPAPLRGLLGLARRWGIGDDGYRSQAVARASPSQLRALVAAVDGVDDPAWDWLVGPEAARESPLPEYLALTCLIMAYDEGRLRLADDQAT
jgi:hypothetical protein